MTQQCWCGGHPATRLGDAYGLCDSCGSVVYTGPYRLDDYTSTTPDTAFYGERYWRDHVPHVLKLPGLADRARTDLSERAVFYLDRALTYLAPGDTALELGCAPGCLSYLLNQAGVQVTGIELGETTVDFVRRSFGVEVLQGPLERLDLERCFDAVIGIDLLEHLPRPLETLRACRTRLTAGGALILQTPCYRGEPADWKMLVPAEHLFLYTERSVRGLLGRAGFTVVDVATSLFPYDMWVVATPGASLRAREDARDGLSPSIAGLITLYRRLAAQTEEQAAVARDRSVQQAHATAARDELAAVRVDQRDKEALITRLSEELRAVRADRHAKEGLVTTLTADLAEVRADRSDKDAVIARVGRELRDTREDQRAKEALILHLTTELAQVRTDQCDKAAHIASLSAALEDVRRDQQNKEDLIASLTRQLAQVRTDQQAKEDLIASVSQEIEAIRADQRAKEALIATVSRELEEIRADQRAKADLIGRLTEGLRQEQAGPDDEAPS